MSKIKHQLLHLIIVVNLAEFALPVSNELASRMFCGYQHVDDYHRESVQISIDEFPWIAQLLYGEDKQILCTGSLINNRYVLTTAYCIIKRFGQLVGVRLGDLNVTSDKDCVKSFDVGEECSDPVKEFEIEKRIPHPKFLTRNGLNDIGLIRLLRDVEYSDYIRPICLPLSDDMKVMDGQELAVSGWGLLGIGEQQTPVKKKVLTKLVPHEKCREQFNQSGSWVSPYHLCASESGTYTCFGDSGGPLMLAIKNQWVQVGVMSFGNGCGELYPIVYVNTAKYLSWIIQKLKE